MGRSHEIVAVVFPTDARMAGITSGTGRLETARPPPLFKIRIFPALESITPTDCDEPRFELNG